MILHTVLKGHYTMTLRAPSHQGWTMDIPNMAVSDMGQIVLYSVEMESCTDAAQRRRQEVRQDDWAKYDICDSVVAVAGIVVKRMSWSMSKI